MKCKYFCSGDLKVTFSHYESVGQFSELLFIQVIMSQEVLAMKLLFCGAVLELKSSATGLRLNFCTPHL